jgi:small subunit ribosomal protein S18
VAAKSRSRKDAETRARPGRAAGAGKPLRRKSCLFCKDKIAEVDYKNVNQLRRYVSERGKIRNRRITGACRRHQRQVAVAVKRAREMALLPYVADGSPPSRSRSSERP